MAVYPAIYRAKSVRVDPHSLQAFVPQVFGDTPITVINFVGDPPTSTGMGWISFQGGNPDFPVWLGAGVTAAPPPTPAPGVPMMWQWAGEQPVITGRAAVTPLLDTGEVATDAAPSMASEAFFSPFDESGLVDYSLTLGGQEPGDTIQLQHATNAESWHLYQVTGTPHQEPDDTWCIPVTTLDGSPPGTAPPIGEPILVTFTAAAAAGGADEVWVSSTPPSDPDLELWYDPSAAAPVAGQAFVFVQAFASSVWTIVHPLPFRPNVTVIDSSGSQVEGDVTYLNDTTVRVTFSAAFSGTAYLS